MVTCLLMFACYDLFESCWDLFTDIVMVQKCHFISCCGLSESCLYLSESYGVVGIKDGSASARSALSLIMPGFECNRRDMSLMLICDCPCAGKIL